MDWRRWIGLATIERAGHDRIEQHGHDQVYNDASLISAKNFPKNFSNFFLNFRIFRKLFVRFVRSMFFPEIGRAETIRLVQKSSNFELSSRFFGRLKTETKVLRKHFQYETIWMRR